MGTKLRVVAGGGQPVEMDPALVEHYSGPARLAFRRIIEDYLHDRDLLRMVDDSDVALEQFTEGGPDGEGHEALVTSNTPWSDIVQALQAQTVELGLARTHKGGMYESNFGHGAAEAAPAICLREEAQAVVHHPAGYQLTEDDALRVAGGTDVFIKGTVLAKAEYICRHLGSSEGMWYWLSDATAPSLIIELIIPVQRATAGTVATAAVDVLKANRQARRQGRRIVGAGHSHGRSSVFSSTTDRRLMHHLAAERVGHASVACRTLAGRVNTAAAPIPPSLGPDHAQVFDVDFPDAAGSRVRITTPRHDLTAADLCVELLNEFPALSVTFSTHNCGGQHCFPIERTRSCPICGNREEAIRLGREVTLHVVGRKELSAEERAALNKELKEKVEEGTTPGGKRGSPWTERHGQGGLDSEYDEPSDMHHYRAEPGTAIAFEIRQHGGLVGRVSGAILEEAVSKVPALAAALGWSEYASGRDREGDGDGSPQPDTR